MDKHKAMPKGYMTVGEIAGKMDVTVRTLQHYDREGLLSPSAMSEGRSKWNKIPLDQTMLDALGIYEFAKKQYYQLSTGQKRRLHLALALTRNPDILFLDEPTAGLDVEGRLSLHEQIRQLKAMEKTILLASHDMTEVENLCDRIAILSSGKITFIGTVEQLGETIGRHYNITIQTEKGVFQAAVFPCVKKSPTTCKNANPETSCPSREECVHRQGLEPWTP